MYLPTFFPKMFIKIPFSLIIFFYSFLALEAFERPNIILIMTDDMGRECIEAHGGTNYKTPHLNGLAAQGLQINHCYSQPICTPSRVKIMTGKYNFRNYEGFGGLPKQEKTFGHALQDAGYKTCIVGKWQLGGNHQDILNFGFDEYCLINGVSPIENSDEVRGRERYWGYPAIVANGELYQSQLTYGPQMVNEYAVNFIKKEKDQPFFLYYPMILPHSPWAPTPHSKEGDKSGKKVSEVKYFKDNIEYIDHLVGNVVKALEESGQRENTLIMFTSDNGSGYATSVTKPSTNIKRMVSVSGDKHDEVLRMPGETTPLLKGKKTYMEGPISETVYGDVPGRKNKMTRDGTGVPLIIDWPRYHEQYKKSGHSFDDLVDFTDFFATLLDVAKAKVSQPIDGISFAPRLRGLGANKRKFVFCHYWFFGRKPELAQDSIHDGKWKLYNDGRFYDLSKDPEEKNSLADHQLLETALKAKGKLSRSYQNLRNLTIPHNTVSDFKLASHSKKTNKKKSNK